MKPATHLGAIILLLCSTVFAGNYVITIDGKPFEVEEGEELSLQLNNGNTVKLLLERKDIITYSVHGLRFDHPSAFVPAKTDLGEGVYQTIMASAIGTIVLIQEYTTTDPSGLVNYMLAELSAEEKQVGYKFNDTDTEITLVDGKVVKGIKSVSTYRGEETTRVVVAHGSDRQGVLIITMIDREAPESDTAMLETFWKTLQIQ